MTVEEPETGAEHADASEQDTAPAKKESVFHRLYVGTGAFDIVGKRKRWYAFFLLLFVACIASMVFRGFNLGIEFEGGTQIQLPATSAQGAQISEDRAQDVFSDALGQSPSEAQTIGTGAAAAVQIRSETLDAGQVAKVKRALLQQLQPAGANGQPSADAISDSAVSASWGGEISQQALIALGVFLALVTVFLAIYFELPMALAAILALLHDILVTAGVYSMVGFEVTPATVIGLLTILGFSLYDTVVVFDKVKENTRGLLGLTRRTYAEAANLAVNQTLMRSINTSVVALLPVLGLLVIGYMLLGSGVLQDLALVQLTGMIVGVLSSVCLATPLLVDFKMRNPKFQQQAQRVHARRQSRTRKTGDAGSELDASDDEALASESRKEKAYSAAASVPARTPRSTPRRSRPTGKPTGKRKR